MIDYQLKFILIFLASFILSFILTKIFILVAKKLKVVDDPAVTSRKIHSQPIPLLGGVPIFLTMVLMIGYLWQSGQLLDSRMPGNLIIWFLLASLILIINGYFDDKYNWPAKFSIWGPIIAAGLMLLAGLKIAYVTNIDGSVLYLDKIIGAPIWIVLLTFAWIIGMTYTTKLLDGIDGLTSSIGLIASIIIFLVSLSWDVVGSTTSLLSLILGGTLLGFLLWNWHPAKVFLGEGGSALIGFTLGVLAIISGSKIATALLVMGLPILDIVWVIIKRWQQHKPFWHGDQHHLHFRLLNAGLSQRQVVLFFSFISLLFGSISLFFTTKAKLSALSILLILMFILTGWLNWRLKKNETTGLDDGFTRFD